MRVNPNTDVIIYHTPGKHTTIIFKAPFKRGEIFHAPLPREHAYAAWVVSFGYCRRTTYGKHKMNQNKCVSLWSYC